MIIKSFWPAIIWGIFIFIICSFPGDNIPKSFIINIPFADKIIHFFLYFLLVILIMIGALRKVKTILTIRYFLLTFFISLFYGFLIEILQDFIFIMRSADFMDIIANSAGSFIGLLTFYYFIQKR
ncbi:MAG: VanZ family protein [Bacteroidales bacterium]|nr:VanZ family protein [Bacteroidales bacterium]